MAASRDKTLSKDLNVNGFDGSQSSNHGILGMMVKGHFLKGTRDIPFTQFGMKLVCFALKGNQYVGYPIFAEVM